MQKTKHSGKRGVRRAASGVGLACVFSMAVAGGALLHVRLADGRRLVASALTSVLEPIFSGRIVIEKIGTIEAGGVDGAEVSVYDPAGERVLHVTGLRAQASLARVMAVIARGGDIGLVISRARVEHADVRMLPGSNGTPSIALAFLPRPRAGGPRSSPAPEVSVWLPEVELHTACVRGTVSGLGDIDVDLGNVGGSVLAGSTRTSIRVRRYSVNWVAPLKAQGTADTQIEIPSASGHDLSIWSAFDGYVGDVQVNAHGTLDGENVELVGDVVRARPEAVRALWPPWPVQSDVSLHVESKGRPPLLTTSGHGELGSGTVEFTGQLQLEKELSLDLEVRARDIVLRSFDTKAPDDAVSASGRLKLVATADRGITGGFDAKTEPSRIFGIDVPAASIGGKIEGPRVSGRAEVRDPTLFSDVDYDVHPRDAGGPVVVDLNWSARVPELGRVPWLSTLGTGQASWRGRGQIVEGKLDAHVDGTVDRFARPGVGLEHARISGSLRGPLDRLDVGASLEANGLAAGPLSFPEVKAEAHGPITSLRVTSTVGGPDAPELTASATVERAAGRATLRDLELLVRRGDVELSGKVKAIEIADDTVNLRDLTLTGAGSTVAASLSISPDELRVRASAEDVDLKKIAAILAPTMSIEGRLAFDVDADLRGEREKGHLRVRLTDGTLGGFSGLAAQAEADAQGRRFSGGAEVRFGDLGALSARTVDAALAGPLLRGSSWFNASGRLEVDSQVDLDRLAKTPAALLVPTVEAGGQVFAKLLLSREELEAHQKHAPTARQAPPPDVDFLLWTDRLSVELREAPRLAAPLAAPRFSAHGVDVQLGFHLEGEGEHGALTARLVDGEGIFAGLTVLADVPVEELWQQPERRADRLLGLPFTAKLTLPSRAIDKYPDMFRPSDLEGEIEATGSLTGSIRSPSVTLAVRGHAIKPASVGAAFPVDVEGQGTYDGRAASARIRATRPEGVVLDAMTNVEVPSLEALLGDDPKARSAWQASGSAKLIKFPVASVAAISGSPVTGFASGTLQWRGINRDPDVQAQVDFTDLKLDQAVFPRAVAVLRVAKGGVVASANLEHAAGGGSATATARVKWASPIFPEIDSREPLDLYFAAHDFRAAALYPLLRGVFTHFDGKLNGTLHLHQEEAAKGQIAQAIDGSFDLQDGVFQIPAMGQEFRKATGKFVMNKKGEVEVTNVSANGSTGKLTASGKMTLKGLSFVSGEGEVRIAKNQAVPLTLEGVALGEAWGTLFLHAKRPDERTVKLDVDVPVFHTDLPESTARDVQSLADHPDIQVGVRVPSGTLSPVPLGPQQERRSDDALIWRITFFLGQDVRLRRGTNLELSLGGEPVVELTDKVRVSGQVDLKGGNVEVFGKRFEIEHGVTKFDGDDPSNPDVSVVASWEAPDSTRIFAHFVGPLRTGSLTLTSEPARSQGDILAILLFGGETENVQQVKGNETGEWVLGGAAVTTGVNKVLSSVTPFDITTRVTSDAQSPTPEVAIRLSPKLTAEISYRTRTPSPLESQDRTLLTLDWRFRRNWSIATTVGSQTSVLDLIWRYRY